ncbi:MAG TPA: SoxY-related AACIE arm protein [Burkholderiales bacterium]|jgi:sulfur-oxidizing protein SoxY|nr:SoxY-related AACIE arm protein [Burkholderiales bacterium]
MITRRAFLAAAAAAAAPAALQATPGAMSEAIRALTGGAPAPRGRVKLDVPELIENGNSVVLGVTVESPMTEIDHVRAIHVFAPLNPLPNMISVYLGPRAGRARFTTRVRVADSQTLVALAQLSDGSFWSDQVSVVVTLAACTEEVK